MEIGKIYLVTLKGGNSLFGQLTHTIGDVCFIAGDYANFYTGAFNRNYVVEATEYDAPAPHEHMSQWMQRVGLSTD